MREKNKDAIFIFSGVLVMFAAVIVDILSTRGVFVFPKIMGYAFFFFISSLAIILANKSVRLHEEVEELNANLEKKVALRTEELSLSLENVKKLKMSQDGDYFLTSLLIKPLGKNRAEKNQVLIDFIVKQKKTFEFKNKVSDLGGDLCRAESLILRGRNMTVFFNADAMGKSMQGAGGALVMGSVFDSILERTRLSKVVQDEYPEKWLKNSFIELHKVFESFQGSMLVSIVMGLIDNRTGLMYFINAEHPVSIIYRDGKASFIDEDFIFRKLGTEIAQSYIYVKTFQMKDGDIVINGSDGRDDIILLDEKTGEKNLNYDHTLFLGTVEQSGGDIHSIVDILYKKGEITDDLSLMSIKFSNQEILVENESAREKIKSLIQVKKFNDAILIAEDHLTLNPSDTETIFLLSYAYKKVQNFKEAIKAGERVRLREPGHIRNLVNLAHCYFRMKDIDRAKYLAGLIPEGGREKEFAKIFLIEE
jgi:tetratricopeptide (TPR) repeat protein